MYRFAETAFLEEAKKDLALLLDVSSTRVSCHKAVRHVALKKGCKTRQAALIINHLVTSGFFRYVHDCGQSFLEKNYSGVVRLSDRVLLAPPGSDVSASGGLVSIWIMPGAAFGDCRHATTRLSVKAIDFALANKEPVNPKTKALDIGTGSGILAITAAALGVKRVLAIDIDPCARKEARENVAVNCLENKIFVCDRPVDNIAERFNLIIGNLRPPTLIKYANQISDKTSKNGMVVLSGMKEEEHETVLAAYKKTFDSLWHQFKDGWCATVLLKKREGKNGH